MSPKASARTAQQVQATGRSGGGVHHYRAGHAGYFATVQTLQAQGVKWLPISPNYYEDLLARLDLDEGLVRRMQALNIAADVARRRALCAYTEPFADRASSLKWCSARRLRRLWRRQRRHAHGRAERTSALVLGGRGCLWACLAWAEIC